MFTIKKIDHVAVCVSDIDINPSEPWISPCFFRYWRMAARATSSSKVTPWS